MNSQNTKLQAGDLYILPSNKQEMPSFLKGKNLVTGVAVVVCQPEPNSRLVEMETCAEGETGEVDRITFHITLDILRQLEKVLYLN